MTSRQINVPSEDFWTVTPFTFDLPEGWVAHPTVEQLAYMHVDGETTTNCGVQWRRVSPQLELRQIAQMSHAVTRRLDPDVKVVRSKYVRRHGWMTYLRLSELTVRSGDTETLKGQVYSASFGPSFGPDRPIEVFEMIGHFDAANGHRGSELDQIISSFRFNVALRADATGPDTAAEAKGA